MYPSSDQQLNYESEEAVYFFTGAFAPFDNFSAHMVTIWGEAFSTVEHAYQWKKFETTEPELAERIKAAGSPWLAKKLAHTSKNQRKDWNDVKIGIMCDIVTAKVAQHEDVRGMLLATGNKLIVENSPVDNFWGCGEEGDGQNKMGNILMKARDELVN